MRVSFEFPVQQPFIFQVQKKQCATCIYKGGLDWDIERLEDQIRDPHIGFRGHRVCHHSKDACCAGFWARHKNEFPMGQIAQRLNCVKFVQVDTCP